MEKVAVLPVPDCACAITSRPINMGLIAWGEKKKDSGDSRDQQDTGPTRCWIADGFSNPYLYDEACDDNTHLES